MTLKNNLLQKSAMPDFGYSQYNEREADLSKIRFRFQSNGTPQMWEILAEAPRELHPYAEGNDKWVMVGYIEIEADAAGYSDVVYVQDVAIQYEEWKGTGLGQMLYEKAIEKAKSLGMVRFEGSTAQSNEAKKAWRRLKQRFPVKKDRDQGNFYIDLTKLNKTASPDFGYTQYNEDNEDKFDQIEFETDGVQGGHLHIEAIYNGVTTVGFIDCNVMKPRCSVSEIAIGAKWKGTGLGQMLYDAAIAEAKKFGCKQFTSDEDGDMQEDAHSAWGRLSRRYPVTEIPKNHTTPGYSNILYSIDLTKATPRMAGKTAMPDFGYTEFNDRDKDLKKVKFVSQGLEGDQLGVAAKYEGKDIGNITCSVTARMCYVYEVQIENDWRGTGLGQMLYDAAIQLAKRAGVKVFSSDTILSGDADNAWGRLMKRYPTATQQFDNPDWDEEDDHCTASPFMYRIDLDRVPSKNTPKIVKSAAYSPDTERDQKFNELASAQRNRPEQAMLRIQHHPLGAGVGSFVVEHTGDLTHRMSENFSSYKGQYGIVKDKVDKVLRMLTNDYGFKREMDGNMKNNWEHWKNKPAMAATTFEKLKADYFKMWDVYASEHAKLTVYNNVQELGRDAAIALGKRDFNQAINLLTDLSSILEAGKEEYIEQAGEYKVSEVLEKAASQEPPSAVLQMAYKMLQEVKPNNVGDSRVVKDTGSISKDGTGWWVETHTLGCRNAADESEDTWWDGLWDFYEKYISDGHSTVLGTPEDGKFVSITPQINKTADLAGDGAISFFEPVENEHSVQPLRAGEIKSAGSGSRVLMVYGSFTTPTGTNMFIVRKPDNRINLPSGMKTAISALVKPWFASKSESNFWKVEGMEEEFFDKTSQLKYEWTGSELVRVEGKTASAEVDYTIKPRLNEEGFMEYRDTTGAYAIFTAWTGGAEIYEFAGGHPWRSGTARKALEVLKNKYKYLIVKDAGSEGSDSLSFWKHMLDVGLVDEVKDDENNIALNKTASNPHAGEIKSASTPAFPTFKQMVSQRGSITNLVSYLNGDGVIDGEDEEGTYRISIFRRNAIEAIKDRRALVESQLSSLVFPLTIYRGLSLMDIGELNINKLGNSWSLRELTDIEFSESPNTWVRTQITESQMDWNGTFWARMCLAVGEEEEEIYIKTGTPITSLEYKTEGENEWVPYHASGISMTASNQTPNETGFQYRQPDGAQGEGSNAYALMPERVEGMNNEPGINTLLGGHPKDLPQHKAPSLKAASTGMLYHWTSVSKATTALKTNKLAARRWKHYIEAEDALLSGTSWASDPTRWKAEYTVRFAVKAESITNRKFEINGNRTYLQTKGMTHPDWDPTAYQLESKEPDEVFVVGSIQPFVPLLEEVICTDPSFIEMAQGLGIPAKTAAKLASSLPPFLYHGTVRSNLDSILENGLSADKSQSHIEWYGAVYMASTISAASMYPDHYDRGERESGNVVLKIDTQYLQPHLLRPDDSDFPQEMEMLSEEELQTLSEKFGDDFDSSSWARCGWPVSLSVSGYVCYLGTVPPQAITPLDKKTAATNKPYGIVMVEMPDDLTESFEIDEDDLAGDGIETEPHITLRFGIEAEDDLKAIRQYLKEQAPFTITLGKTGSFPPSPSSEGAAVVIVNIDSPDLARINEQLALVGKWKKADFEYHPHMTLAYVKEGTEQKYVGNDSLEGEEHEVTELVISDADKNHHVVKLGGTTDDEHHDTLETKVGKNAVDRSPSVVADVHTRMGASSEKVASSVPTLEEVINSPGAAGIFEMVDWPEVEILGKELHPDWDTLSEEEQNERITPVVMQQLQSRYDAIYAVWENTKDGVSVFRTLDLPEGLESATDEGQGFGVFWSWSEDGASSYCTSHASGKDFTFYGRVRHGDVDWTQTFYCNVVNDVEKEIRVRKGATVTLEEVKDDRAHTWMPIPDKLRSVTAGKTAAVYGSALPYTFEEFCEKNGGFVNLFNSIDPDSWEQYLNYDEEDLPVEEQERAMQDRAFEEWNDKYYELQSLYDSWKWPLPVWRTVTLKNIGELRTKKIGIYWSYEEDAAAAHWGQGGGTPYILEGRVTANAVDWVSTLEHNLNPSIGDEEKEVTLKEGAKVKLVRWQDSNRVWNKALPEWKAVTAKATADDHAKVMSVVKEYHAQFMPQLEFPVVEIVNSPRSRWLGQDAWMPLIPTNTVVSIQQNIIADDLTLRKVVAHELAHHEDSILNYAKLLPWQRKKWDGHGASWRAIAERMNAVLGANFITKTSDQTEFSDTGKVYYLAIIRWHNGTLRYAVTFNPSAKQVDFLQDKFSGRSRDEVRLFRTTDPAFIKGPNIGSGWIQPMKLEHQKKLEEIWNSGESVPVPAPPKKTPFNAKAIGAKIFNEAHQPSMRYSPAMIKKFLTDPVQLARDGYLKSVKRFSRMNPSAQQWVEVTQVIQHLLDLTMPPALKGADVPTLLAAQQSGKLAAQNDRNAYVPRIHTDPVGLHREPLFPEDEPSEADNPPVFKMVAGEDLYLYHGSPDGEIILEAGKFDARSHWGTRDMAEVYAEDGGTLFKVPISRFDTAFLQPDKAMISDPYTYLMGHEDVEPEDAENRVYLEWEAGEKTWQECLRLYGAVLYTKPLPVSEDDAIKLPRRRGRITMKDGW